MQNKSENSCLELVGGRPSCEEAEEAVKTLLRYIGEDVSREGVAETPARVVRSFAEFFEGYHLNAEDVLSKTFGDMVGYDDIVLVRDIEFVSHCEHHMLPVVGRAHVAYIPNEKVVGISKLARIVDVYAKRLTTQENMSRNILEALDTQLAPLGAAVVVCANHQCMSLRGAEKGCASTVTSVYSGCFKNDVTERKRLMDMISL